MKVYTNYEVTKEGEYYCNERFDDVLGGTKVVLYTISLKTSNLAGEETEYFSGNGGNVYATKGNQNRES